ncbi:MAG: hypothetical protein ABSB82_03460 [Terriglobia bacterium]
MVNVDPGHSLFVHGEHPFHATGICWSNRNIYERPLKVSGVYGRIIWRFHEDDSSLASILPADEHILRTFVSKYVFRLPLPVFEGTVYAFLRHAFGRWLGSLFLIHVDRPHCRLLEAVQN